MSQGQLYTPSFWLTIWLSKAWSSTTPKHVTTGGGKPLSLDSWHFTPKSKTTHMLQGLRRNWNSWLLQINWGGILVENTDGGWNKSQAVGIAWLISFTFTERLWKRGIFSLWATVGFTENTPCVSTCKPKASYCWKSCLLIRYSNHYLSSMQWIR